jgi:hypothetical protein
MKEANKWYHIILGWNVLKLVQSLGAASVFRKGCCQCGHRYTVTLKAAVCVQKTLLSPYGEMTSLQGWRHARIEGMTTQGLKVTRKAEPA